MDDELVLHIDNDLDLQSEDECTELKTDVGGKPDSTLQFPEDDYIQETDDSCSTLRDDVEMESEKV